MTQPADPTPPEISDEVKELYDNSATVYSKLDYMDKTQCPFVPWVVGCDHCMRSRCKLYKGCIPTTAYKTIECYRPEYMRRQGVINNV